MIDIVVFFCGIGFFISFLKSCSVTKVFDLVKILALIFIAITAPEFLLIIGLLYVVSKAKLKMRKMQQGTASGGELPKPTEGGKLINHMIDLFTKAGKPIMVAAQRIAPKNI